MGKAQEVDISDFTTKDLEELVLLIEKRREELILEASKNALSKIEDIAKELGIAPEILISNFNQQNKKKKTRKKAEPKYKNPKKASETWSGRGRKPKWLEDALKKGKKLEDFQIKK